MQNEYSILSDGFQITIQGLTLVAGNQFHIYSGSSDYGLYTIVRVAGDTYTTSTRMRALSGNYIISQIQTAIPVLLRTHSKNHAARYYLKKGIMELGPSGFPFEKFIDGLFKHQGYTVEVGKILQGKCVTHEIDVIDEKENQLNLMECKYRNQPVIAVDVKTPLYIHSRFEDVLANEFLKYKEKTFTGWVITNSKFTSDAIAYGGCKGMQLLGWDYPVHNSLKDWVDRTGLYPLTCLTSLTRSEKEWLLLKDYVLVKDIYNNQQLLLKAGVKEIRIKAVSEEGAKLYTLY